MSAYNPILIPNTTVPNKRCKTRKRPLSQAILRGIWLLERILGEHVPPPPDDVPAVEPDIRGALSIRDQLDKHRNSKSCMSCHLKIDPPGFALENYDVIGGWRDHYRAISEKDRRTKGQPVDASYDFPANK